MSNKTLLVDKLQHRRDSSTNWATKNPILAAGELGIESNTNKVKIGDGTSHWNVLPYFGGGGGTVSWGDIEGDLDDQTDLKTALDSKGVIWREWSD